MPRRRRARPPEDQPTHDQSPTSPTTKEATGSDEQSPELKEALANNEVDLSAEEAQLAGQEVEKPTGQPILTPTVFDPESAWHQVDKLSERVSNARGRYEVARDNASGLKKTLEVLQKQLEALIQELRWKEQKAVREAEQPSLQVPAVGGVVTAGETNGVEGVGRLQAEGVVDDDELDDDEDGEGEGDEEGVGSAR